MSSKTLWIVTALLCWVLIPPVQADDADTTLAQVRELESETTSLLLEHYLFEEALLTPDNDRLMVFMSIPHGASIILKSATLYLDGKQVFSHRYSSRQLERFLAASSQPLLITRIGPGPHRIKLEVTVISGTVNPMSEYRFSKGKTGKYVHFILAGERERSITVEDW